MSVYRNFLPNSFYHIYNRGNRKNAIFYEQQDYSRFLSLMRRFSRDYNIEIYLYCLMPNHFHLLVQSGPSPNEISLFMHRFMTSYVMYLNKKYFLVGRLFQSPYQTRYIRTQQSLNRVTDYIKRNPVKAGLVRKSEDYKWLKDLGLASIEALP